MTRKACPSQTEHLCATHRSENLTRGLKIL